MGTAKALKGAMLRPEDNLLEGLVGHRLADAWMRKASSISRTLALMIRWSSSASVVTVIFLRGLPLPLRLSL